MSKHDPIKVRGVHDLGGAVHIGHNVTVFQAYQAGLGLALGFATVMMIVGLAAAVLVGLGL